jgi:hypothetical protein
MRIAKKQKKKKKRKFRPKKGEENKNIVLSRATTIQ